MFNISDNPIGHSWALYLINWLFPQLQMISINNISVYCPLLETILMNYVEWNLTIDNYNDLAEPAQTSVKGIACVDYREFKYYMVEVTFSLMICILIFLFVVHWC